MSSFYEKHTNLVSRTLYVSDSTYIKYIKISSQTEKLKYLLKQKSHVQHLMEVCAFPCFMRQHCELRICPTRHSMLERSVICHSSHLPPANQCCYCVSGWSLRLLGYYSATPITIMIIVIIVIIMPIITMKTF